MNDVIISPIFYMGNKKKLIKKGLVDLFPSNIETFIDVFAGSAVVSMNVKANRYIVNDIDSNLNDLYRFFRFTPPSTIISHIKKRIDEYDLAKERTKRNEYHDEVQIAKYKAAYINLRNHYNKVHSVFDFYTLMFYSFSQQFRFNSKGEFNMPCGNDCFTSQNEEYINNGCNFFSQQNVCIAMQDFKDVLLANTDLHNTFFYCDPPYLNTTATYNEGRGREGWSEKDEIRLHQCLDNISAKGGKWALSSVKSNKGKINQILVDWVNKHDEYNEYSFDGHTYSACGKGNSNAAEVLITNYKGE